MSHAAIVCREYDTPAVVGTGFATKAIKTGDWIKVDGDQGIVTIVKRGGGV
jgi:pyruvate, water dikinase